MRLRRVRRPSPTSPRLLVQLTGVALGAACAPLARRVPDPRWSPDLPAPSLRADVATVDTVARGVLHRAFVINSAPWAIHMLDVDRAACWRPVALKGGRGGAVGREKTSVIAAQARSEAEPGSPGASIIGAVNADFFLFQPPGLTESAHIEDGRLVAGPSERPVFAVDSAGRPWLGVLRAQGRASSGPESIPVSAWNRHSRDGVAFFDSRFGSSVDSVRGSIRVVLDGPDGGNVVSVDTSGRATPMLREGSLLEVGPGAASDVRSRMLLLARTRAHFTVAVHLAPFFPRDAVGGFPVLVRDSAEVAGLDSAGEATFAPVRHPRTIVAIGARGRRLMLVTVDGRQPGHSAGMTLREEAQLVRDLGATDAMNLDGGGSTTLVIASRDGASFRYAVVNQPSDSTGERPVGNALAVVAGACGR
jgi:Phosphodiester glycosidase